MIKQYVNKTMIKAIPLVLAGYLSSGAVSKENSSIELPGKGYVSLKESIIPGGHFSWGEATDKGTRIPANKRIVENIVKSAQELEQIREHFGNKPIKINSWYRDPVANKEAGGEKNSRHLCGDAIDFVVEGINPKKVYSQLDKGHYGGLGLYPRKGFDHIDWRGYQARWIEK